MRFFSNDAKETNDDVQTRPEDDSPAVPQQRIGSPWSNAPADSPAAETHEAETDEPDGVPDADDRLDTEPAADHDDTTADDTAVDDTVVDDTVGDDTVVDDTVADDTVADDDGAESANDDQVDLSLDEQDNLDQPRADDEPAEDDDETVTSPDASADGLVDQPADTETTDTETTEPEPEPEPADDEPHAVDAAVDAPLDSDTSDETPAAEADTPAAAPVEYGSSTTTYTSAASANGSEPAVEDPTPADTADNTVAVAAVPVAAAALSTPAEAEAGKPGSVPEKNIDSFFGEDAAKGFQERWRDVQLRFVDSPKDATAEAAALVDEAVDQVTANLKAQKDTLLSDSDDTEKLRLELRGYREILNKVLSL